MIPTYRIRRAEDGDSFVDLKSVLRSVFGMARPLMSSRPRFPAGTITFDAIFDQRMVGSITLQPPRAVADGDSGWRQEAATLLNLDVDAQHQESGCREALLDVALQWARANECRSLEVLVPAKPSNAADFYLANDFHIVGIVHDPAVMVPSIVLGLRVTEAQPHTDAWYSKHHGAWFASVVRH